MAYFLVDKDPEGLIAARFAELLGTKPRGVPVWPLPNMVEVNETAFWWHRSSYSFRGEASTGQIKIADRDPHPRNRSRHPHWAKLSLYLVDHGLLQGGGFAVLYTYNWMDTTNGRSLDSSFPAVRYFEWRACDHKYEETGPVHRRDRGWHEYTCKKCSATYSVDSGD